MSKYYVNKFLFMVDRDPRLLERYIENSRTFVGVWEQSIGPKLLNSETEVSSVHVLTDEERAALIDHDFVALFEMGAHFFLNLTIFIGMYDEPYAAEHGPLAFQREFAAKLEHWRNRDYPTVET